MVPRTLTIFLLLLYHRRMGFFETARHEGAKAYGEARAEKYGRQERMIRWVAALAVIGFLTYCYFLGQ